MNKARRIKISMAIDKIRSAIFLLSEAETYISAAADGERDAFDNLPENFQESDRYASMEDTADLLEEQADALSDIICSLNEVL